MGHLVSLPFLILSRTVVLPGHVLHALSAMRVASAVRMGLAFLVLLLLLLGFEVGGMFGIFIRGVYNVR